MNYKFPWIFHWNKSSEQILYYYEFFDYAIYYLSSQIQKLLEIMEIVKPEMKEIRKRTRHSQK
jgi:hypothetical protein